MEAMEGHIDDLKEQVDELTSENKLLKSQISTLKKRKADEVAGLAEVGSGAGAKRLKIAVGGDANKENVKAEALNRRSSCVFGIGLQAQKESKKNKEKQMIFSSTEAVVKEP